MAEGKFRDDLYYRLNVIEIRIPPLRERREDIPLLAEHFVERLSHEIGQGRRGDLRRRACSILMDHNWPGNVRELENAVERAIVTCRDRALGEADFAWLSNNPCFRQSWAVPGDVSLAELERRAIIATLERTRGNVKEAAVSLGVDRSTLYDKLKRYEIAR